MELHHHLWGVQGPRDPGAAPPPKSWFVIINEGASDDGVGEMESLDLLLSMLSVIHSEGHETTIFSPRSLTWDMTDHVGSVWFGRVAPSNRCIAQVVELPFSAFVL